MRVPRLGPALVLVAVSHVAMPVTAGLEAEFEEGVLLVQLDRALPGERPDGSFPLRTGRIDLDEALRDAGVRRIEFALSVALANAEKREAHARAGLDRIYRLHLPPSADLDALAARFAGLPGVVYAETDRRGDGGATFPNDPRFADQWGLNAPLDRDVDAPEAWDLSVGGAQIVAVLDTGADSDHEDFAGKLLPGYDFANNDADPEDDHGHGSNVGSIAAAASNNARGIAGACWNCRIMPLKVLNSSNSGFYSWWADAMVWATDHGARVINLSAGGTTPSMTLLNGVQYAWRAGVIHVSITHNDNCDCVRYPGRYAETIAVGATDNFDRRAVPFCYSGTSGSNFGTTIDVVAPGEMILGVAASSGYNYWCGTSQAAPLVAGLVGIMRTMNPAIGREEARHVLRATAEDRVGRSNEDTNGFDVYHGWGRVNMHRALQAVRSQVSLRVDGKSATRLRLDQPNPVASSWDFVRGNLGALSENEQRVELGTVVCLENDSPDADTLGNEDTATPSPGAGFFYLARFRAAPGSGRYGGSSRNRDRSDAAPGDCAP